MVGCLVLVFAYQLAFLVPLLAFPLLCWKRPRIGAYILLVYLALFVLLSSQGEYVMANHGGADWRREWCPKHLVESYHTFFGRPKTSITWLGAVYWPCIFADQCLLHPTEFL